MILEDARLMSQDIFLVMVDLKEAFDTIDHTRMLKVVQDLGYPADSLTVLQGLYTNAYTRVITPYGKTDPIPIKRGTLQGDGLSPFLFILYLEPLLRWLNVGARGYHPGSLKHMDPITHVSNTAYADDLSLYTGGHSDMINQTDKVSTYCTWAGLTISQPKTLATAALYHRAPAHPFDHQLTRQTPSQHQNAGKTSPGSPPPTTLQTPGVWFTMDLNWKKQQQDIGQSLQTMGAHLGRCYHSQAQKLRTMQTCLKAKARYAFPLMCYSAQDIERLDRTMDAVVRKAYRAPTRDPHSLHQGGSHQRGTRQHLPSSGLHSHRHKEPHPSLCRGQGREANSPGPSSQPKHTAFTHPHGLQTHRMDTHLLPSPQTTPPRTPGRHPHVARGGTPIPNPRGCHHPDSPRQPRSPPPTHPHPKAP
jgi:hypothetical protein